jgi:hypothetical protein
MAEAAQPASTVRHIFTPGIYVYSFLKQQGLLPVRTVKTTGGHGLHGYSPAQLGWQGKLVALYVCM